MNTTNKHPAADSLSFKSGEQDLAMISLLLNIKIPKLT